MKILVTGANGQLGQEIRRASHLSKNNFIFSDLDTLDVLSESSVRVFAEQHRPDIIMNCAGYTAVDRAETESATAFALNGESLKNISQVCKDHGIFLFHISTDYVFDGNKSTPYTEDDIPHPLSVYGASKRKGEEFVLSAKIPAAIIRTSWLHSSFGNNFVKTILRLSERGGDLKIVYDQVGCPTSAEDLAHILTDHLDKFLKIKTPEIFHFSNEGVASWYDFALEILRHKTPGKKIRPIRSSEFPQAALRPSFSVMGKEKIKRLLSIEIPHWTSSLEKTLAALDT